MTRAYLITALALLAPFADISSSQAAPLNFTVNASEATLVDTTGGTPRLALTIGSTTRYASYASGSGTAALTFTYNTQAGDLDLDGIAVASPLDLNGGTITDLSGNAMSPLSFTAPVTSGVMVDHPSLSMDFIGSDYILSGTHYNSLPSFLSAAGGSFTRTTIGSYFDSSGTLQTAATNTPRFDHDPVTHVAKGLMIEETRTNAVPNSSFTGITAATYTAGSTTVSNWRVDIPAALTAKSVTLTPGTANGMNYVDVRIVATNPTASTLYPTFQPVAAADQAVSSGVLTTGSAWVGVSAVSGGCGFYMQNRSMDSGRSYISGSQNVYSAVTPFQYRTTPSFSHGASAAWASLWFFTAINPATSCDITARIALPQLEVGAFATSYIPTTSAAVTRQRDNLSFPVGTWYNATTSTLMAFAQSAGVNGASTFADINNNTFNERFQIRLQIGPQYGGIVTAGGALQVATSSGAYIAGQNKKIAMALATNDSVLYADGVNRGTDTGVVLPTPTQIRVGGVASGSEMLNGTIRGLKYYPARVPNAQLQLLTQ